MPHSTPEGDEPQVVPAWRRALAHYKCAAQYRPWRVGTAKGDCSFASLLVGRHKDNGNRLVQASTSGRGGIDCCTSGTCPAPYFRRPAFAAWIGSQRSQSWQPRCLDSVWFRPVLGPVGSGKSMRLARPIVRCGIGGLEFRIDGVGYSGDRTCRSRETPAALLECSSVHSVDCFFQPALSRFSRMRFHASPEVRDAPWIIPPV